MIILFCAVLGAIIGSFCNVVIHRLPRMLAGEALTLSLPASHCPHCLTPVRIRHNIPILSWLILHGRCAVCQVAISWRYPLVELLPALLFAYIAWRHGISYQSAFDMLAISMLLPLFFIDLDTQLLPDRLTLPLAGLALLFAASGYSRVEPGSAVLAAVLGYGIPWLLSRLFCLWRGIEGMGRGDMKLFAGLGAWLGPVALLDIVTWSSLLALLCAVALLRIRPGQIFAFGPYPIVVAIGWVLLFGH